MLYRHSEVFRTIMGAADGALIALAWLAAYAIRFDSGLATPLGIPAPEPYLYALALIVPLFLLLFRSNGLYEARRMDSSLGEVAAIVRSTAMALVLLTAITFFARNYSYSRGVLGLFAVMAPLQSTLRL